MQLFKKLEMMFSEMVLKKAAAKIPDFYHRDFRMYTNGIETNYQEFLESHKTYYATPIQYQIEYDHETFLEAGDKLAGRVWITTQRPNEAAKKIEVMLIVQYKADKIYRLWELTYPDWSKLPAFNNR